MRTTISIAVNPHEAMKTRQLALKRGFASVSDYIRFLLTSDDVDLISEAELLRRAKQAESLHRSGRLIRARSMAALLK